MRVRYTPRARADLDEIVHYIAIDDPHAAERVRKAIRNAIKLLAAHPYLGIQTARAPELRSKLVHRYPYRVHYQLIADDLWIVHIRHTARLPWSGETQ
jgi:plasmid stabilization system protein ParE